MTTAVSAEVRLLRAPAPAIYAGVYSCDHPREQQEGALR